MQHRRYKPGDEIDIQMADSSIDRGVVENSGDELWGYVYYKVWLIGARRYAQYPVLESKERA